VEQCTGLRRNFNFFDHHFAIGLFLHGARGVRPQDRLLQKFPRVSDIQLDFDACPVRLDCLRVEVQFVGNLLRTASVSDQSKNLQLTIGEAFNG
jgi:hypothetical protein